MYLNDQTGQPDWTTVHTGRFGTKETSDGHLEDDENDRLYYYYAGYFGTDGQADLTPSGWWTVLGG